MFIRASECLFESQIKKHQCINQNKVINTAAAIFVAFISISRLKSQIKTSENEIINIDHLNQIEKLSDCVRVMTTID